MKKTSLSFSSSSDFQSFPTWEFTFIISLFLLGLLIYPYF